MEVEIIKANSYDEDISNGRRIDRLRVAAYCRVSTDDEDQIKDVYKRQDNDRCSGYGLSLFL